MYRIDHQSGFSLIELAIVLFILSLLLVSLLPPLSAQIEQKQREETQSQLDEIREVIYGFAYKNNRLPCPDCRDTSGGCSTMTPDDGIEDPPVAGAACASEVGNLPWVTLGVKESDAWVQYFTYRVTDNFADSPSPPGTGCTPNTLNVSFALCSDGDIHVYSSNTAAAAATGDIAQNIPAIVVSHGRNWSDAPSSEEEENYDDSTVGTDALKKFVYRDYSATSATAYDDMMIWISPNVLRTKMLNAGILP